MLADLGSAMRVIPVLVGNEAVNFFLDGFTKQAWQGDGGNQPWKPRKAGNKRNKGRAILVNTGALKRGIVKQVGNGISVRVYVSGSASKYADMHNFGFIGGVQVTPHHRRTFGKVKVYNISTRRGRNIKAQTGRKQIQSFVRRINMPRRQFIGSSTQLDARIRTIINQQVKQALS